ncbi:MAG TPA: dihydrodipicolinate synthase family protein, partial [Hyphomonas sp.]|nr:dihydrodipicolinate synthase family protein [Hyphomonas sp.]
MIDPPSGIFAAVLTPLDGDLAPDHALFARHCRWLLAHGCDGLSILGTTGEANAFSRDERIEILERLVDAGIPASRLIPGTGCCAIPDTVALSRHATAIGAAGVLVLPPFYYKGVSDDGLFAAYSEVIERVGDDRLRVYLYHFPQMTAVPLSRALIGRLIERYPGTVAGMKDSSGDTANMIETAAAFPGFRVFAGSDESLLPVLRGDGAGCITAVGNVAAEISAKVLAAHREGDADGAEKAQARLNAVRKAIAAYPLSAGLKEIMAGYSGIESWRHIRPPLIQL